MYVLNSAIKTSGSVIGFFKKEVHGFSRNISLVFIIHPEYILTTFPWRERLC